MKKGVLSILLSIFCLSISYAQEKTTSISFGFVSNINKAQLGLRMSVFPNSKIGYYLEYKRQDYGYSNYRGSELSVSELATMPNLDFDGIKYSRINAFNTGVIIPINNEISFYNGLGIYKNKAFAQLSRNTNGNTSHYHVLAYDDYNWFYNLGFEMNMVNLIINVGYDIGLSEEGDLSTYNYKVKFHGLNIGIGYRIPLNSSND